VTEIHKIYDVLENVSDSRAIYINPAAHEMLRADGFPEPICRANAATSDGQNQIRIVYIALPLVCRYPRRLRMRRDCGAWESLMDSGIRRVAPIPPKSIPVNACPFPSQ